MRETLMLLVLFVYVLIFGAKTTMDAVDVSIECAEHWIMNHTYAMNELSRILD